MVHEQRGNGHRYLPDKIMTLYTVYRFRLKKVLLFTAALPESKGLIIAMKKRFAERATFPDHLLILYLITLTTGVKLSKLHIKHFVPSMYKYSLITLFSNTFTQWSSCNGKDRTSQTEKTMRKNIVSYILTLTPNLTKTGRQLTLLKYLSN